MLLSFKDKIRAYEFAGRIESIEGNQISMAGFFVVKDRPDLSGANQEKKVIVEISDQTKIIKETIRLPRPEEIKDPNGIFRVDDLKKENREATLDELKSDLAKSDIGLRVSSSINIYGRANFIADQISYRVPIEP